jgi:hypothetical protein
MPAKYDVELQCPCGKLIPVYFREAGESKVCACGSSIEVPRLSELRLMTKQVHTVPANESLSKRQLIGRYILGTLFAVVLLVDLYLFAASAEMSAIIRNVLFVGLAWFTLIGRLWARLILVILLVVSIALLVRIHLIHPQPASLVLLAEYVILLVALMIVKT